MANEDGSAEKLVLLRAIGWWGGILRPDGQVFECSPEEADRLISLGRAEPCPEDPIAPPSEDTVPAQREIALPLDESDIPYDDESELALVRKLITLARARELVLRTRLQGTGVSPAALKKLYSNAQRDEASGCLVWQRSKSKHGYGQTSYGGLRYLAHRLVWIAHHGPPQKDMVVCHACDNPSCIEIEHLFLGARKDNFDDMRAKGRMRHRSILSDEDVRQIRKRAAAGESVAQIARDYPVKYEQVLKIKNGHVWKRLVEDA
ncbi:MAG: HNH endonuclease [Alphaproteobacteria bacterium]|nr:HNH endonuclease [Alphaproteobacteria bacterium]